LLAFCVLPAFLIPFRAIPFSKEKTGKLFCQKIKFLTEQQREVEIFSVNIQRLRHILYRQALDIGRK
jgi:hypothetical protein